MSAKRSPRPGYVDRETVIGAAERRPYGKGRRESDPTVALSVALILSGLVLLGLVVAAWWLR